LQFFGEPRCTLVCPEDVISDIKYDVIGCAVAAAATVATPGADNGLTLMTLPLSDTAAS